VPVRVDVDGLSIAVAQSGDVVRLFLGGALDRRSARALTRVLDGLGAEDPGSVWVDLAGVSRIDAVGIDALVRARWRASELGHEFLVRSPSADVARLLELRGASELLSPARVAAHERDRGRAGRCVTAKST
jgi:anti-anti-sigma factor